ncbi:MAG: acyltransferase family protein [Janthinobacterium lividum]
MIAALSVWHLASATAPQLFSAATYTWDYYPPRGGVWDLGHLWSLAIEEQFYLIWPACMVLFRKKTALLIALGVVILSPFVRMFEYFVFPSLRPGILVTLHTQADPLMVGCALALLMHLNLGGSILRFAQKGWVACAAGGVLLIDSHVGFRSDLYVTIAATSVRALAIVPILLYAVSHVDSPLGKVLNSRPMRHLGLVSYSVYLWQQLFTGSSTTPVVWVWLEVLIVAEISYWLIEKPSFRWRDRLTSRLYPKEQTVAG